MYVYRDTDGQPDDPRAAVAGPDEHDAAYWYDLPGTGGREDTTPRVSQETRGPFEPLVSSADPPGTTPRSADRPADAEAAASQEYTQARKLEQIKDLYLTAEAIGEANVDKHFDHLLVQQRELISDYFKQSNAARPEAGGAGQAGVERPAPRVPSWAIPRMPPRPPPAQAWQGKPRTPTSPPISPAYGDPGRKRAGRRGPRPRGGRVCHRP